MNQGYWRIGLAISGFINDYALIMPKCHGAKIIKFLLNRIKKKNKCKKKCWRRWWHQLSLWKYFHQSSGISFI